MTDANRHKRRQAWNEKNLDGRWRCFTYEKLTKRDKLNLDIFWIKDKSLEDAENLPEPLADDIADALEQFRTIARDLKGDSQARAKGISTWKMYISSIGARMKKQAFWPTRSGEKRFDFASRRSKVRRFKNGLFF